MFKEKIFLFHLRPKILVSLFLLINAREYPKWTICEHFILIMNKKCDSKPTYLRLKTIKTKVLLTSLSTFALESNLFLMELKLLFVQDLFLSVFPYWLVWVFFFKYNVTQTWEILGHDICLYPMFLLITYII